METLNHPLSKELRTLFEGEGEDFSRGLDGVALVVKVVGQDFEGKFVWEVLLELAEGEDAL